MAKKKEPHQPYAPPTEEEPQQTPSEALPAEVTESVVQDIQEAVTEHQTNPADPKPEPEPPRAPVVDSILVEHTFSEKEIVTMAKALTQQRSLYNRTENELSSIKKDYTAKLEKIEVDIGRLADLINDGFEMRAVSAVVVVAVNKLERTAHRCYYRRDTGKFIRRELITGTSELDMFTLLPENHPFEQDLPAEILSNCV